MMKALGLGTLLAAFTLCGALARAAEPAKVAKAAAPAPARRAVAIMPPLADTDAARDLGFLMQARAATVLADSGEYVEVSLKQILRLAEREGMSAAALATKEGATLAARRVGATRALFSQLKPDAGGWVLQISATDGAPAPQLVKLPAETAQAAEEGAQALARAVAAADKVKLAPASAPPSASDEAVRQFATCHAVLIRQPVGIDNPSVISATDLAAAADACRKATVADPQFQAAWSGLGLALALQGDDGKAVEALPKVKPESGYLPMYWVARYWLVTRYQSNEAGAALLRAAIQKHPGFLLARGYLGEHLNAVQRHEEALIAFKEYAALVPNSPYALSRIGYTLARLGRHDEALDWARRALELEPTSRDLVLELGSRHVDAGKFDKAIAILKPVASLPDADGEALLRLGYAYLGKKDLDSAEPLFRKAEAAATKPSQWRTRGRAKFDIAKVLVRRGDAKKASQVVLEAMKEGFKPYSLAREDDDLVAIAKQVQADLDRERFSKVDLETRQPVPPREASPFPLTSAGEIDLRQKRPTPPSGFDVLKF